ncbi:hypothetical protein CK203_041831 [Vitis vinifera]|uniref:Uncharacterized protein n=1 Tax=Vitis vinifera TaxID=29760 RepID=A0A438HH30_VITVI|nr:hypothetical protein CK203_041831 [Vitis vinifera]
MSQFQIPRPTYTPSSISKASESIFQDTIDGSMSHLGASASTLQARIPPTYVSPSMDNLGMMHLMGFQQQYSTPTLANHEARWCNVNFQFNTNMGKVNEFNISINHYPSLNSNVGVPSTSQRYCFMAPRRARGASKALGKRPAQPSQDGEAEARRKASSTPVFSLRSTNTRVTISEPIFPTLVKAFYSRVTFGHGGPITSTVRGVQIHLDPESICRILDIPPGGLRVYDAQGLADGAGFRSERGDSADVRPCRCPGAQTHSPIWPLHDTSVQGCGGGFEQGAGGRGAPAVMTHMMSSRWPRMKLEKAPNGSWIRRADRPSTTSTGRGRRRGGDWGDGGWGRPSARFEHREPDGPSGQPSFTEPHYTHTSPGQAPDAAEHAPWMELSAQITSLGTRIEERMDQHQATHEHILQRLDRQERQHEELMAYLRAVFPPPPAAP